MKEAIKILTLLDLIFILFLVASGPAVGIFGEALYYMGFFLPTVIAFYYAKRFKREREEERGLAEAENNYLSLDGRKLVFTLPIMTLSIGLIILSSITTTLILNSFGFSGNAIEDAPLIEMLVVHAIVPAILEEMLFRYVPMKLLLPYSPRVCVFISSIFFALIHCNLFQIPYALIAGMALMLIDVIADSIWPSVILHIVNNTLSVIMMKYCNDKTSMLIFIYSIALVELLSIVYIALKKTKYKEALSAAIGDNTALEPTYAPLSLVVLTIYIAFMNLFN